MAPLGLDYGLLQPPESTRRFVRNHPAAQLLITIHVNGGGNPSKIFAVRRVNRHFRVAERPFVLFCAAVAVVALSPRFQDAAGLPSGVFTLAV